MTQLATLDDLLLRLRRDLDSDEAIRADALLTDVSASVRSYTGQQFTGDETIVRLKVRNGKVRLPQFPVSEVASVDDVNGNPVLFTWDAGSTIHLSSTAPLNWFEIEPRRSAPTWVDVTYTYGYDAVPDDIIAVVCSIASRALGTDPEFAGVSQESIGDASIAYGILGAAGALGMTDDERAVLDRYRPIGGTITVG